MIDLGCRLKQNKESFKFLSLLKELNFYFVEEPFDRQYENYKNFDNTHNFALGESFYNTSQFNNFKKLECIKYFQPDTNIIPASRILSLQENKKPLILHNWSPSISFYSNINTALILKNCQLIEYSVLKFPNNSSFLKKNYFIKNGNIFLKNTNGLGITFSKNNKLFIKDKINIYKSN